MIVVNRFQVPYDDAAAFRAQLEVALAVLAEQPGHLAGHLGRNADDPQLWLLVTRWEGVGAYRRALSSYEVKVRAWPVLQRAIAEPSAFEVLRPGEAGDRDALS